jgi:hypothetical protein
MDSKIAMGILEDWINKKTSFEDVYQTLHLDIDLPIVDEVVYSKKSNNQIEQYTFKHLIKIAYNLKDND